MTELNPDNNPELLKELHILTRDGKLNQDSRRKLKQIYHLYNFFKPILEDCNQGGNYSVVDHGAGKSYLGFILYDLFLKHHENGEIYSIENRQELVLKSQELAARCQFDRMRFCHLSVQDSISSPLIPVSVDVVTALHACDTATDDAIEFGLKKQAKHFVLVPCCQAQVAGVLRKNKSVTKTSLSEIWRHSLHTREFGSHLTNVLRCLQLEAHGYKVTVTELIGLEHSMKNELIIATKNSDVNKKKAAKHLEDILSEMHLEELRERFFIPS